MYFNRDYWISKIKNITKKLLYFNGEWGEHSKKSSEKNYLLCKKLDPNFLKNVPQIEFLYPN